MDTPTPEDVRKRSELLRDQLPETTDPEADPLKLLLDDDAPVISELTGRSIGPDDTPGEEVPLYLRPVAVRAFAMRAERNVLKGSAEEREGAISDSNVRSESYGPISFTYFGPTEAASASVLDPDPQVHELLWALATEAKRAYWMYVWGKVAPPPYARVLSVDWAGRNRRRRGY